MPPSPHIPWVPQVPPQASVCVSPQAQRWHVGSEPFGRTWQAGDVVGCMIDLTESHITFTLNGEVLISDAGSELAFKDFDVGEGELGGGRV